MGNAEEGDIYKALGVRRVINCMGSLSLLGASSASPRVWRAMQQANDRYAEMHELMERAGGMISDILGVEAAAITTGGTYQRQPPLDGRRRVPPGLLHRSKGAHGDVAVKAGRTAARRRLR